MSGLDITRSLFLGDLSCFCTEQDVFQLFQNVGPIEEIRIMRGKDNKNLGYGFITFRDQQTANQAFRMDGCVLVGRPLKVGWAHDRNAQKFVTTPKAVAEPKGSVAQLHFSFISKHVSVLLYSFGFSHLIFFTLRVPLLLLKLLSELSSTFLVKFLIFISRNLLSTQIQNNIVGMALLIMP